MIINRFALQRVEVQNSLFFMEAFEIMEMDMEFLRKLPTPKELKEQFPVSEKIAAIKEDRDRQIREIFEGKDDRLLLIIGQKDMNPTVASLILSLESCISVLAGWILLNQKLSARELSGCVLMFAAIILAQLPSGKKA